MKGNAPKDSLVVVAQALHPERQGWVAAIGDRDGFARPLWLDLSKPNWTQRLRRYALDQSGARLSRSPYRRPGSRKAENVLSCAWIQLDDDGASCWRFATVQPSLVVVSSTAGHHHVLWRVDDLDIADVGRLDQGQAELLGGDPGFTAGVTSTVRLPVDEGALVRLADRCYRAVDLRRWHRPSAASKPPKARDKSPADRTAAVAFAISRALAAVERGESRNLSGYRLALDLWSHGLSEDEAIEAGRRYVETVEDARPGDDPYELSEWRSQVRRRFDKGPSEVNPEFVAKVDDWEIGHLANPAYGSSQKTMLSAVAGLARASGSDEVELSRRQAMIFARLSRGAVDRAFDGSKTKAGLIGTALKLDRRRKQGRKGSCVFKLIPPPSPPVPSTSTPTSSRYWPRLDTPLKPSPTVPENHDAFRVTRHGPRLVLDVLLNLDQPASLGDLTRSPALSPHKSTIRKQLKKLAAFSLVHRLDDGRWVAVAGNLEVTLDQIAEKTERPSAEGKVENWSERTHRHNEEDRLAFALAPSRRKEREAEQLQRVCQRRQARRADRQRPRIHRHPFPDPIAQRQRREERTLVRRHVHRPRVIRTGQAAKPQYVLVEPPTDLTGVP